MPLLFYHAVKRFGDEIFMILLNTPTRCIFTFNVAEKYLLQRLLDVNDIGSRSIIYFMYLKDAQRLKEPLFEIGFDSMSIAFVIYMKVYYGIF